MTRAVWKQEVLWAEAPVVDVAIECDEHYHFVLDISGNKELMEGHTKAGQFVQVFVFRFGSVGTCQHWNMVVFYRLMLGSVEMRQGVS